MLVSNPYQYRRRLPHYQKADAAIFATFRKLTCEPFSPGARDLILEHCVYEHGKRIELYVAVVMPEHMHMLFRPLRDHDGWPFPLHKILRSIKGISAREVNKLLRTSGPVWQDESFDHVIRSEESLLSRADYIRMNPVRRGLVRHPRNTNGSGASRIFAAHKPCGAGLCGAGTLARRLVCVACAPRHTSSAGRRSLGMKAKLP